MDVSDPTLMAYFTSIACEPSVDTLPLCTLAPKAKSRDAPLIGLELIGAARKYLNEEPDDALQFHPFGAVLFACDEFAAIASGHTSNDRIDMKDEGSVQSVLDDLRLKYSDFFDVKKAKRLGSQAQASWYHKSYPLHAFHATESTAPPSLIRCDAQTSATLNRDNIIDYIDWAQMMTKRNAHHLLKSKHECDEKAPRSKPTIVMDSWLPVRVRHVKDLLKSCFLTPMREWCYSMENAKLSEAKPNLKCRVFGSKSSRVWNSMHPDKRQRIITVLSDVVEFMTIQLTRICMSDQAAKDEAINTMVIPTEVDDYTLRQCSIRMGVKSTAKHTLVTNPFILQPIMNLMLECVLLPGVTAMPIVQVAQQLRDLSRAASSTKVAASQALLNTDWGRNAAIRNKTMQSPVTSAVINSLNGLDNRCKLKLTIYLGTLPLLHHLSSLAACFTLDPSTFIHVYGRQIGFPTLIAEAAVKTNLRIDQFTEKWVNAYNAMFKERASSWRRMRQREDDEEEKMNDWKKESKTDGPARVESDWSFLKLVNQKEYPSKQRTESLEYFDWLRVQHRVALHDCFEGVESRARQRLRMDRGFHVERSQVHTDSSAVERARAVIR